MAVFQPENKLETKLLAWFGFNPGIKLLVMALVLSLILMIINLTGLFNSFTYFNQPLCR